MSNHNDNYHLNLHLHFSNCSVLSEDFLNLRSFLILRRSICYVEQNWYSILSWVNLTAIHLERKRATIFKLRHKSIHLVLFPLYLDLFWDLTFKHYQTSSEVCSESLGIMSKYWYIEPGPLSVARNLLYFVLVFYNTTLVTGKKYACNLFKKYLHHFLNDLHARFSRAWCLLLVFLSSSDWFLAEFAIVLIGQSDYLRRFWLHDTPLKSTLCTYL